MSVWLGLLSGALGACTADQNDPADAITGMQLLEEFRCHRSEEKHIIVRGVEDDYSQDGVEEGRIRPGLLSERTKSLAAKGNRYDQLNADRYLQDYLEVPSLISDGLLVIKLRATGSFDNANDTLEMGLIRAAGNDELEFITSMIRMGWIEDDLIWTVRGDILSARLGEIRNRRLFPQGDGSMKWIERRDAPLTLLDYIRTGDDTSQVDIFVQDDTSVDFIGVAVCEEPVKDTGLSFFFRRAWDDTPGIIVAGCSLNSENPMCDPYVGDTPCQTRQPLVCIRPDRVPVPSHLPQSGYHTWSGGEVRFTGPVAASEFATIDEADAFCRAEFGPDWRVANMHEGGNPAGFSAFGTPPEGIVRAWVDIKGQPYATCWAR